MTDRAWRHFSLAVHHPAEDAVTELFQRETGAAASVFHDIETARTTVSVYIECDPDQAAKLKRALREQLRVLAGFGIDVDVAGLHMKKLRPIDWAESWKRHFHPLEIADRLLIKPSWSRRKPPRGWALLVLDPGLSFGTGQHPTTRFCLEQLVREHEVNDAASLLDIGCGTGILALSAERIGYTRVEGFDFDPAAVRSAEANAAANAIQSVTFQRRDLTRLGLKSRKPWDVVCANLMADLLISQAEKILNRVKPGGLLVLAGILRGQYAQVKRAFEQLGARQVATTEENEWRSGAFRR